MPDWIPEFVTGVIHVGANIGQERFAYAERNVKVVWIEPIPWIVDALRKNIVPFPNQRAIEALIADQDDVRLELNIANNDGASSSIFRMKDHCDIWPDVKFESSISVKSVTLSTLIAREDIDLSQFQGLVLDTQGSELMVLQGAPSILQNFGFIKIEAADFEAYENGCREAEISEFLVANGFREVSRELIKPHPVEGAYYDISYQRFSDGRPYRSP